MNQWRCIKTVRMKRDTPAEYVAFTEGSIYQATTGATPSGERMLQFTNDRDEAHLAGGRWLFEHFERVEE